MPVVRVASSFCDRFTGGLREIEVEAQNVRGMMRALDVRFPGLGAFLEERAAVAIDGTVYQRAWTHAIAPESEVVLLPRIGGG